MTRAVPYVVPFETLKKLISQMKESDVIIPFIGSTGQGKTTTVGRLSNANLDTKLSGSPLEKHVGNAVNNSLLPILIYWRDRDSSSGGKIYLLDIPGFGGNLDSNFNAVVGKAMDGNSNNKLPYARVPTEDQLLVVLNSLGFVFPHIVIVVKDVIDDASAKYFEKLNTFNKDTKFHVAYNADLSIGIDHEYVGQRINHYKGVFKHVQDITFETYSAAKPHTFQLYKGYRIDHLEQSLVKLARLDSFKPYPKEIDFHLNAIPEGSGNDSPKSNTWGRFVRDLIPVVGPACNFVENCKERKYGHAVLDATFVAVDGATLGFSAFARTSAIKGVYTVSQATRSIWTPVGRGAYNYVGKQGLNILRRTGVGLAEGATSALVRRVANKKKKG